MALLVLKYLTYAACHRSIVAGLQWRQWQTYMYKISLYAAAGVYVIEGMQYLFPGVTWSLNDTINDEIKELMLVFIIGSADFVVELHASVCELDKSVDLRIEEGINFNRVYKLHQD